MEVSTVKPQRVLKPLNEAHASANAKAAAEPKAAQQAQQKETSGQARVDLHIKAQDRQEFSMHELARQVSEELKKAGIKIEFNVNQEANRVVIVVKDPVTGQVVRQIPPEEYRRILSHLKKLQSDHQSQGIELDVRF